MSGIVSGAANAVRSRSSDAVKARYSRLRGRGDVRVQRGNLPGQFRVDVRPAKAQGNGSRRTLNLREGTTDWGTFKEIFFDETYDLDALARGANIRRFYDELRSSRQVPLVLDIGANIGVASLYFDCTYPGSRIIAVEPEPSNFDSLSRNCARTPNIILHKAGIASKSGRLSIVHPCGGEDAFRTLPAAANGGDVAAITVEDLLSESPTDEGYVPFIAKIDIEGFESDLFSGNCDWIDKFPVLIVELHDWLIPGSASSRNFLRAVSQLDRDFVYLDRSVFSLSNGILARYD